MIKYLFFVLSVFVLIAACDLEKDIEVDLPDYEIEIVAESYIEAGQPLRALVTESLSYIDLPTPRPIDENTPVTVSSEGQTFTLPLSQLAEIIAAEGDTLAEYQFEALKSSIELLGLLSGAEVTISHNAEDYMLEEGIYFDLDYLKIYNYGHPFIVPADYTNDFSIQVTDTLLNRNLIATTRLLPPVPIDSILYNFNASDTLAAIQAWYTDDATVENYYRFMIHYGTLENLTQDGEFDDSFFNGNSVPLGTGFDFGIGDTAIVSLFHIDEVYHDFLETYDEAFFANGNPFAQPAQILTNIEGGRGIFAGLSYVRDTVIIE